MSKPTWTYSGAAGSRDNASTIGPKLETLTNRAFDHVIIPEYNYDAAGDGSTDDDTPIENYITQLNNGSNKSIGGSRVTTYMISTVKQITRNVIMDFVGTLKRTAASTADTVLQLSFGTAGKASVKVSVDGNSANANTVTGILIDSGANNTKSKHELAAEECDIGIQAIGNVEKINIDAYVRSCVTGVNVNNDGSANTADEVKLNITGSDCDNFFLADGTEKISGSVHFSVEQGDNNTRYAIEQINGAWSYYGEIRGVHGGANITTIASINANFDLTILGKGGGLAALNALICDAGNCILSGRLILYEFMHGVWIKSCSAGSSLQIKKRDSGATGTGLRIGDFDNSKQVSSFTLDQGSVLFGSTNAIHLDYSTNGTFNIDRIIEGGVTISANSAGNKIIITKTHRAVSITNNRTQNDNVIFFKGSYTNAELEEITSPFKGMMVEASSDTSVYGSLYWNGTNWRSANGLTYNAGTNSWA